MSNNRSSINDLSSKEHPMDSDHSQKFHYFYQTGNSNVQNQNQHNITARGGISDTSSFKRVK